MAVQVRGDGSDARPEYEVGYGKPPKGSRFQKGKSGNPGGVKKYKLDYSGMSGLQRAIAKEMRRKVQVREAGKVRRVMQQEVIAKRLVATMVNGSELERWRAIRSVKELRAIETLETAERKLEYEKEADHERRDAERWKQLLAEHEEVLREYEDESEYPWDPQYAWDPHDEFGELLIDPRELDLPGQGGVGHVPDRDQSTDGDDEVGGDRDNRDYQKRLRHILNHYDRTREQEPRERRRHYPSVAEIRADQCPDTRAPPDSGMVVDYRGDPMDLAHGSLRPG